MKAYAERLDIQSSLITPNKHITRETPGILCPKHLTQRIPPNAGAAEEHLSGTPTADFHPLVLPFLLPLCVPPSSLAPAATPPKGLAVQIEQLLGGQLLPSVEGQDHAFFLRRHLENARARLPRAYAAAGGAGPPRRRGWRGRLLVQICRLRAQAAEPCHAIGVVAAKSMLLHYYSLAHLDVERELLYELDSLLGRRGWPLSCLFQLLCPLGYLYFVSDRLGHSS